jgi:hypothetical protein
MATTLESITEADILAEVIASARSALPPELARTLIELRFSAKQLKRMGDLADKNNAGTITGPERAEMENYARVGTFLSLLQSKARLALKTESDL